MTQVSLSVFGKTHCPDRITGAYSEVARTAIDMLIQGVPHEAVFSFLEKKKRELKQDIINIITNFFWSEVGIIEKSHNGPVFLTAISTGE